MTSPIDLYILTTNADSSAEVFQGVEALADALPNCDPDELRDAAKSASESPGEAIRLPAVDQTYDHAVTYIELRSGKPNSPLAKVMAQTNELDGDGIGQQVVSIILNREELTVDQIVAFYERSLTDLYDSVIAPAIDRCEEIIHEENVAGFREVQ